jgi:hypothetical protein
LGNASPERQCLQSTTVFGRRSIETGVARNDSIGTNNTANTKERSMKLKDWEVIIQQIIEESNCDPKESGKQKILMGWREKLARDPHLLQLYQIDEIVREVRNRLKSGSQQRNSGFQVRLDTTTSSVPAT